MGRGEAVGEFGKLYNFIRRGQRVGEGSEIAVSNSRTKARPWSNRIVNNVISTHLLLLLRGTAALQDNATTNK